MKFAIDLFPVVAFFAAYQWGGMDLATAVVMGACVVQTLGYRMLAGEYDKNHVLAVALVLPFGAAALLLDDPEIIQWQVSAENWILAALFLGSHYVGDRPVLQRIMGAQLRLPDAAWRRMNMMWVIFFALLGVINLIVARLYSEEFWVDFRLFGLTGLSVAFMVIQFVWLLRQIEPEDEGDGPEGSGADGAV